MQQRRGGNQRSGDRGQRRSEFEQKVLDIRRTARVVAGGRRFSFRAAVVVGDRKGRVGLGMGKGISVAEAVEKGAFQAKKAIFSFHLTDAWTIAHETEAKFAASRVVLKPAREGRGLVAGGPVRAVAELGGIRNLTAKILGRTSNKLNNAKAVIVALKKLKSENERRETAMKN